MISANKPSFGINIHTSEVINKLVKQPEDQKKLLGLVAAAAKDGIAGDIKFDFSDKSKYLVGSLSNTGKVGPSAIRDVFLKPGRQVTDFEEKQGFHIVSMIESAYKLVSSKLK